MTLSKAPPLTSVAPLDPDRLHEAYHGLDQTFRGGLSAGVQEPLPGSFILPPRPYPWPDLQLPGDGVEPGAHRLRAGRTASRVLLQALHDHVLERIRNGQLGR